MQKYAIEQFVKAIYLKVKIEIIKNIDEKWQLMKNKKCKNLNKKLRNVWKKKPKNKCKNLEMWQMIVSKKVSTISYETWLDNKTVCKAIIKRRQHCNEKIKNI